MATQQNEGIRFAPAKSIFYPFSFFVVNFTVMLVLQFSGELDPPLGLKILSIALWLLTFGYAVWQWTGTYYELKDGQLNYRCGLEKGSIPVSSIRKIETGSRFWGHGQTALSFKGLLITYNHYDDILIAPKDEAGFLKALQQLNPGISIDPAQPKQPAANSKR